MDTEVLDEKIDWFDLQWFNPEVLKSFEFAQPAMFWVGLGMPVLLLFRWILIQFYRQRMGVATFDGTVRWSWAVILKLIPDILLVVFWSLLTIALARPQRSDVQVDQWTEGIDITLLIDVSSSMQLKDFKPDRLASAKKVASKFIEGRENDQIGLAVFGNDAFSLSPLTTDYEMLQTLVKDHIYHGMMQNQSTAIGNALNVGTSHMEKSESKTKIMILISDGENTAGKDPIEAAKYAYGFGIKIYTIAIGKNGMIPTGQRDFFGREIMQESNLDETTLREIARIGQGEFFRATNSKALESIFAQIDEYEKSEIKETRYKNLRDYYMVYVYWAILSLLLWLLLKSTFITNAMED